MVDKCRQVVYNKTEVIIMTKISGTEIVEKRNILNEIRQNNMTLQQLRFFSIYLAKINARDLSTKTVRFSLSDFQKIMGIGRMNIQHFKKVVDSLLSNIIHIPNKSGGLSSFTLFNDCLLDKNEKGEWYVEISANDKALPLMFDFKSHYFTYQLWNALQLKSATQIRMYEILKQYESIGKREIEISELRELLGITSKEYSRFSNFRVRVLDSCQQALSKNTDISFVYEKGKSGNRGKWLTIIFYIKKNEHYVDHLSLKDFIDLQPEPQIIENVIIENDKFLEENHSKTEQKQENIFFDEDELVSNKEWENPNMTLYLSALNNEFSKLETSILVGIIDTKQLPDDVYGVSSAIYKYLGQKYLELKYQEQFRQIKNRFKYLKRMIEADFEE